MKPLRFAFVLAFVACASAFAESEALGEWAVDFKASAIDGKTVVLSSDFKGKLVLMDFWATWCEPCMEEVPSLVAAWKKYGSGGKLAYLGVTLDSPTDVKKVKETATANGMSWQQILDDLSDVDGKGTRISAAYKVEGIPAPFLIDGDTGRIVARDGELRGASLQRTLEAALKTKK